jgi:hypothetical protein
MTGLLCGGVLAVALALLPERAAACVPEGVLWSPDLPIDIALVGTVVSGPDAEAEWRIDIDRTYAGSFPSPFRLNFSGPCGYDTHRLVAGQRFFLVTYGGGIEPDRIDTGSALIWLLDHSGDVTGELNVNAAHRADQPHFATLNEILAGLDLPDTAVPVPPTTPLTLAGVILLLLSLVSFGGGHRRAWHDKP